MLSHSPRVKAQNPCPEGVSAIPPTSVSWLRKGCSGPRGWAVSSHVHMYMYTHRPCKRKVHKTWSSSSLRIHRGIWPARGRRAQSHAYTWLSEGNSVSTGRRQTNEVSFQLKQTEALFSHWSVVRIDCFGEMTKSKSSASQARRQTRSIHSASIKLIHQWLSFCKEEAWCNPWAGTLAQMLKVNTWRLPFCTFPCCINEALKI